MNRSYGGREFKLKSKKASNLPDFDPMEENSGMKWPGETQGHVKPDFKFWQIVAPPPSRKEVMKWIEEQKRNTDIDVRGADPGELDQFSQVGLKHVMETITILRAWCSLMARPRRINMGGSIPRSKSPVVSNRNYNP